MFLSTAQTSLNPGVVYPTANIISPLGCLIGISNSARPRSSYWRSGSHFSEQRTWKCFRTYCTPPTPMQSIRKSCHFGPQNVSSIKAFLLLPLLALWFQDTSLSCLDSWTHLLTACFPACFLPQMTLSTAVRVSLGNVKSDPVTPLPHWLLMSL